VSLDDSVDRIAGIRDAVRATGRDTLVLCHGGPNAEPEDVRYVLDRISGVAGFFGASSIERLPTETAITETVRRFRALPLSTGAAAPAASRT
jgi:predicted TIM-barrel enzyme